MNRDIVDDVRQGAADAFHKTGAHAESAKEGIVEAIGRVSEIFQAVRAFGFDDLLDRVGLQRKQSNALAISMFGVGVACGAVLGVVFAPTAGRDARRMIGDRVTTLFNKSSDGMHHAMDRAKDAAKDAKGTVQHGLESVSSKMPGLRRGEGEYASNGTNGTARS